MLDVKKITKTVMMEGEPVEVVMTEMMRPKTKEELAAMTPGEREHCKFQSALNARVYVAEEGIGIRLENDILVTGGEPEDLIGNRLLDIAEIEQLMAK